MAEEQHIGRYAVTAEIGRGSMGVVHRAYDPVMEREVAIKTILPPHGLPPGEREGFFDRFRREAQAAGGLSHPGIVTVYDFSHGVLGSEGEPPFIAMEFVEGATLHELICGGPLEVDWVLSMGETLAEALSLAHAAGIVHRDLKPANILVRRADGAPKIADFGVARVNLSEPAGGPGATYGSPAYAAPECLLGLGADARSDLFSLAVILYEALSGQRPFVGPNFHAVCHAIVHDEAAPIRSHRPSLLTAFDRFFARALAKDPAERFQDGAAFVEALRTLRAEQAVLEQSGATVLLPAFVARKPPLVRWALILPPAALLLILSFAAGWLLRPAVHPPDARKPGAPQEAQAAPEPPGAAPVSTETVGSKPSLQKAVETPSAPPKSKPRSGPAPVRTSTAGVTRSSTKSEGPTPAKPKPEPQVPPPSATARDRAAEQPSRPRPRAEHAAEPATIAGITVVAVAPAGGKPAQLDLDVRSSIKEGTLKLLVDGEELYSSALESNSKKLTRAYKKVVGKADQTLTARIHLKPGPHAIEGVVFSAAKSKEFSDRLDVDLPAGEARTLRIVAGRAFGRRLSLKLEEPDE